MQWHGCQNEKKINWFVQETREANKCQNTHTHMWKFICVSAVHFKHE